jgi:hypothetical protein
MKQDTALTNGIKTEIEKSINVGSLKAEPPEAT